MADFPKSLADETIRHQRLAMLHDPHIRPLTSLVKQLRLEKRVDKEIPFFDPMDGGTAARVLFLLEAPGAKAVQSGFISRNNPDETAKNMFGALRDANLPRTETILWNIVPWYLGSGSKIRPAKATDIEEGKTYVPRLLCLLPRLQAVVLVGLKAQRISDWLSNTNNRRFRVHNMPHPSPLFVNRKPCNRDLLIRSAHEIVRLLPQRE